MIGLGMAAVSISPIFSATTAVGIFTPFFRLSLSIAVSRIVGAMGPRRQKYDLLAYVLANSFSAALHLVKLREACDMDQVDSHASSHH